MYHTTGALGDPINCQCLPHLARYHTGSGYLVSPKLTGLAPEKTGCGRLLDQTVLSEWGSMGADSSPDMEMRGERFRGALGNGNSIAATEESLTLGPEEKTLYSRPPHIRT